MDRERDAMLLRADMAWWCGGSSHRKSEDFARFIIPLRRCEVTAWKELDNQEASFEEKCIHIPVCQKVKG